MSHQLAGLSRDALDELAMLQSRCGEILEPQKIVQFAADETTALHRYFTWDDTEAARKWRIEQARRILRMVVTVVNGSTQPVRAMVSLSSDPRGYRPITAVLAEPELRSVLLQDAISDLRRVQCKYNALAELERVWRALDDIAG